MLGAFQVAEFCSKMKEFLQLIGWVLWILKLAIPLLIIGLGIKDFGVAVIASKEDETKTAAKRLLWRFIAGVAIFFLPNIVLMLFESVADYKKQEGSFSTCRKAVLEPWS